METEITGAPTIEHSPETTDGGTSSGSYRVILYNDDWHSMDEVVFQVQKATGCTVEKAVFFTMEAHSTGRSICFRGARDRCHEVVRVLREIRLQAEVDCD